jgi:hypothetical protein
MGIRDLFPTLEAALAYHESYEQQYMVYHEDNVKLYNSVLPVVAKTMPFPLSHLIAGLLPAIMPERLALAFRLSPGGKGLRVFLRIGLKVRGIFGQFIPQPIRYRTEMKRKTYPNGHKIKDLGT